MLVFGLMFTQELQALLMSWSCLKVSQPLSLLKRVLWHTMMFHPLGAIALLTHQDKHHPEAGRITKRYWIHHTLHKHCWNMLEPLLRQSFRTFRTLRLIISRDCSSPTVPCAATKIAEKSCWWDNEPNPPNPNQPTIPWAHCQGRIHQLEVKELHFKAETVYNGLSGIRAFPLQDSMFKAMVLSLALDFHKTLLSCILWNNQAQFCS